MSEKKVEKKTYELRNLVEQYYDLQKQRIEAFNRVVAWIKNNVGWQKVVLLQAKRVLGERFNPKEIPIKEDYASTIEAIELKYNVHIPALEKPYSWYAERLVRGKVSEEDIENMVWITSQLINLEKEVTKKIESLVSDFEIYDLYLSKIRGMGPILSAGLIGWIAPISRFDYPSRLRAYAGLIPQHYKLECEDGHKIIATSPKETCPVKIKKGSRVRTCGARIVKVELVNRPPKREKGYFTMINLRLKTHFMGRIAVNFEFQNSRKSYYRFLYEKIKEYYTAKHPEATKGHIRNKTYLWVSSIFASHLWEV
ncbi:MAG: transposase, partial [Methermicoccaceae archaeon]